MRRKHGEEACTRVAVGFIELGVLGAAIARNLLEGPFKVTVHRRSGGKVEELVRDDAKASTAARSGGRSRNCPQSNEQNRKCDGHNVYGIVFHPSAGHGILAFSALPKLMQIKSSLSLSFIIRPDCAVCAPSLRTKLGPSASNAVTLGILAGTHAEGLYKGNPCLRS
jgi:hypothetical protein